MPTGNLKFFNVERGYGFLTCSEGPDVFIHARDLRTAGLLVNDRSGTQVCKITDGGKVTFDTEPGKSGKGPKAINVAMAE